MAGAPAPEKGVLDALTYPSCVRRCGTRKLDRHPRARRGLRRGQAPGSQGDPGRLCARSARRPLALRPEAPREPKKIPLAAAAPAAGYGPSDIQGAYKLPSARAGAGQTIAIVDAYDDQTAEADLAIYRSTYGLPPCTTANGCFKKVNQSGVAGLLPGEQPGLGPRDQPRPRHGLGDLPELPHPAGRGDLELERQPLRGRGHGGAARRDGDLQQLRRRRRRSSDPSSNSHFNHPGDRDHGVLGRQRLRGRVPGRLAVRHRGRRHHAQPRPRTAAAGPRAPGAAPAAAARPTRRSRPGRPTRAARKRTVADVSAVADPNTGVNVYDRNCNGHRQAARAVLQAAGASSAAPARPSPIIAVGLRAGRQRRDR